MSLIVFGLNHNTASIDIREKISFSGDEVPNATKSILENIADEVVIFSTCNRTEIYLANLKSEDNLYKWLSNFKEVEIAMIKEHSYIYYEEKASKHLFRVTTGLDSIALGEPQILGQVKQAYQTSLDLNSVKQSLNKLFQESFHVAKNIRSETELGKNSISIVYAALKLADNFFSNYKNLTIMIIGAGQTGDLAIKNITKKEVGKIIIANRTLTKAQDLALKYNGFAITLEQVENHISEADIIISATNKDGFTVESEVIETSQKLRKNKVQLFLDLAVPRDIDPKIKELSNSYLYSVDDLESVIAENKKLRNQAAQQAELLIDIHNKNFLEWLYLRKHHTLIKDLHTFAHQEKDKLKKQALKSLEQGKDPKEILEELATKLTKKLTHQPSLLIRRACETGKIDFIEEIKSVYDFE